MSSDWKPHQHAPGIWSVARELSCGCLQYLKRTPHKYLKYHEARKLANETNRAAQRRGNGL
jgi:hypothetical protein